MTYDKNFLLTVGLPLCEAAYNVVSETPTLPSSYTLMATIKLAWSLGKLSPDNPYFGFIAIASDGTIVVVIRGTETLDEWLDDFDATLEDVGGFSVFAGFQRVFEALLPSIRSGIAAALIAGGKAVCFLGHSLGAIEALLGAASLGADACVSYACPRGGDTAFAAHCVARIKTIIRVANTKDIVTHQPSRPLGCHAGKAAIFDGWALFATLAAKLDAKNEHSLELAYTPGVAGMGDPLVLVELS